MNATVKAILRLLEAIDSIIAVSDINNDDGWMILDGLLDTQDVARRRAFHLDYAGERVG